MSSTRALLAAAALASGFAWIGASSAHAQACMNEIMPMRAAVEKDGGAVKAAIDKKTDRSEICNSLKRFTATEAKFIKYLDENQSWCGVPPDFVATLKKNHGHTLKLRGQACAVGPNTAAAGPRIPQGPGLSEALGTSRAASGAPPRSATGTFDTLSGPSLAR